MPSRSSLRPVSFVAFLLFWLLAVTVPLHAQSGTATITGTITDPAEAIIPAPKFRCAILRPASSETR